MRAVGAIILAVWSTWLFSQPAFAEKRVALVIGNSAYQNVTRLGAAPKPTAKKAAKKTAKKAAKKPVRKAAKRSAAKRSNKAAQKSAKKANKKVAKKARRGRRP
jgi:uncharacterized caspase-like protein